MLAPFGHAALASDWHLAWAAVPLLDAPAGGGGGAPLPVAVGSALGLRSPPPLSLVIQHLQKVCVRGWWCVFKASCY